MTVTRSLAALICAAGLAGCGQGPGELTTGSLLTSAGNLVPSMGAQPQRPYERVAGNLYRINVADRRIDDTIQRENYSLLRAAETAKQLGATHFVVVNASQEASVYGAPQQAHGQPSSVLVRVVTVVDGAEPPVGAISADEIFHFFGPTFGRTPTAEITPAAAPG